MPEQIKVLVVDDDPGMRTTTVEILSGEGYAVTEACDGNAALERLASDQPHVVLLDVRMPGRDGISVVENMHPAPPPPEVMLVSAYDIDPEVRRRLGSRVQRYLRKPVPPPRLLEEVSDAASRGGARSLGGDLE